MNDATHKFLQNLAKQFKKDYNVWKKSIIVLTKANSYKYIYRPTTDEEKEIPARCQKATNDKNNARFVCKFQKFAGRVWSPRDYFRNDAIAVDDKEIPIYKNREGDTT